MIIGNRAYQYEVPQVTYAHRDAEAFRRYVVDVLGFDPENVIHKKDADKATMERVFGNRDSLTGSELWRHVCIRMVISDVVVFYSGHGIPGMNDKRGYLLPVNAHPDTAELNGYPDRRAVRQPGQAEGAEGLCGRSMCFLTPVFQGTAEVGG